MLKLKHEGQNFYSFKCPGCDAFHIIDDTWQFNGNYESPTVRPSVLLTSPAIPDAVEGFEEWKKERRCHSFITDGNIQFLEDCTHNLKGMTVPLIEF